MCQLQTDLNPKCAKKKTYRVFTPLISSKYLLRLYVFMKQSSIRMFQTTEMICQAPYFSKQFQGV